MDGLAAVLRALADHVHSPEVESDLRSVADSLEDPSKKIQDSPCFHSTLV